MHLCQNVVKLANWSRGTTQVLQVIWRLWPNVNTGRGIVRTDGARGTDKVPGGNVSPACRALDVEDLVTARKEKKERKIRTTTGSQD